MTSESLGLRSLGAQLLFHKLINGCDDFGRTDARPRVLRGLLYSMCKEDVPLDAIQGWLVELSTVLEKGDEPPVLIFFVDGKPYLQMLNWEKHRGNSKRGAKSRWPSPPTDALGNPGEPEEAPGEPRIPTRGDEVTRCLGDEVTPPAEVATPPAQDVSGFVRMLNGKIPTGLDGETWETPTAWFEAHAEIIRGEAEAQTGETSGTKFNGAFKSVLMRFWRNKSPPARGAANRPGKLDRMAKILQKQGERDVQRAEQARQEH